MDYQQDNELLVSKMETMEVVSGLFLFRNEKYQNL